MTNRALNAAASGVVLLIATGAGALFASPVGAQRAAGADSTCTEWTAALAPRGTCDAASAGILAMAPSAQTPAVGPGRDDAPEHAGRGADAAKLIAVGVVIMGAGTGLVALTARGRDKGA